MKHLEGGRNFGKPKSNLSHTLKGRLYESLLLSLFLLAGKCSCGRRFPVVVWCICTMHAGYCSVRTLMDDNYIKLWIMPLHFKKALRNNSLCTQTFPESTIHSKVLLETKVVLLWFYSKEPFLTPLFLYLECGYCWKVKHNQMWQTGNTFSMCLLLQL